MSNTIKVGDYIFYRGAFGRDMPKRAKVEQMDVTEYPRDKYGESAQEVTMDLVRQNRVLFMLDDGHWCYSDQFVKVSP